MAERRIAALAVVLLGSPGCNALLDIQVFPDDSTNDGGDAGIETRVEADGPPEAASLDVDARLGAASPDVEPTADNAVGLSDAGHTDVETDSSGRALDSGQDVDSTVLLTEAGMADVDAGPASTGEPAPETGAPVCTHGDARCSGGAVQACGSDGRWENPVPCDAGYCNGGGVCGNCASGSTRCSSSSAFQQCGADGQWAASTECTSQACVNDGCAGVCSPNATRCMGNGVQKCSADGQWTASAVACGAHQSCTAAAGATQCTCTPDATCSATGTFCASVTAVATCTQDAQGCWYASSIMTCANGACSGSGGTASCCTNACTSGNAQCLTSRSIQKCQTQSNTCTGWTMQSCASGFVCERYGSSDCLDPNWAEWPMPNSYPDVTAGAAYAQSYASTGDGTVLDRITGLTWQSTASSAQYSWANAKSYCAAQTTGGYNDWRLPAEVELLSIVDYGSNSPAIDATFASTPVGNFWSSTPVAGSSHVWLVDFATGSAYNFYDATAASYVRCVR